MTQSVTQSVTQSMIPTTTRRMPRTTTGRGNHRVWLILSPRDGLSALGRLKAARPGPGVHRFDPRCFGSEEDLLVELALLGVDRIPSVHRLGPVLGSSLEQEAGPEGFAATTAEAVPGDTRYLGYIEGEALSAPHPPGTPLSREHLRQLTELFGRLASLSPSALELVHSCPPGRRPRTSGEFLHGLIRFTRTRVWAVHRPEFRDLFAALGVDPGVLAPDGPLGRAADRLTDRPFCLLHGDLHRDNLIVAEDDGALWTIDWELALLGDPLYDLATHLHLMGYPPGQERAMVMRWAGAVEYARPGAAAGMVRDLPRYLAYKRVQSVFTDIIRQGMAVWAAPPRARPGHLDRAGRTVSAVLHQAAAILGLSRAPSPSAVEAAYAALARDARSDRPPSHDRVKPFGGPGPRRGGILE